MKKKIALIVVELETDEEDCVVDECMVDEKALALDDEDIRRITEVLPDSQKLTEREKEVLTSILKCRRRAETAEELYLSESSVKKHSRAIYAKFGVKNKFELLTKLYRTSI